jgi:hypothetical protein
VSERRSITDADYGVPATLETLKKGFAAVVLFVALAVSAQASAAVVIPRVVQAQMFSILDGIGADDLAYMPTYAPKHYRYSTFGGSSTETHITLSPGGTGDPRTLYFSIVPFGRTLPECGEGHGRKVTVQGKTVWSATGIAWRCLRAPSGQNVVVKVHGAGLSQRELVDVAASAKRIP